MSRILPFIFFALFLQPCFVNAEFDFYHEDCTRVAANGCAAPLVQGPKCLVTAQGPCKEYEKIRECDWEQSAPVGLPQWKCVHVKGACVAYEQVCERYEKICTAGYRKVCNKTLKPYVEIRDELAWAIYQPYMRHIGSNNKKPLQRSIVSELQPYFQTDLKNITVASGAPPATTGITDCSALYFPDVSVVDALVNGKAITSDNSLRSVLHAFRHTEHCSKMGGRKKYAAAWFSRIDITMRPRIDLVIKETLDKLSSRGSNYLHAVMPMEADASNFALKYLDIVKKATRHGSGKPIADEQNEKDKSISSPGKRWFR